MIPGRRVARWLLALAIVALAAFLIGLGALRGRLAAHYTIEFHQQRIVPVTDGSIVSRLRGLIGQPVLLITLDDGPTDATIDGRILDVLDRHGVNAMWFVTCANLDPADSVHWRENRETLKRIAARGDVIGNHGYHHLNLRAISADRTKLMAEITGCSRLIDAIAGKRPKYFRPPWGVTSPAADAVIAEARMHAVLWSANSYDSLERQFGSDADAFAGFRATHPALDIAETAVDGDIVLMHDHPQTAAALDQILLRWRRRGLVPVLPDVAMQ